MYTNIEHYIKKQNVTYCSFMTLSTLDNMLIFLPRNVNESLTHSTGNHWATI